MVPSDLRKAWPILCLIPLLGWWAIGLTDLDEGFYGAVAADMIRRGDWITPSISGEPWFEKPILVYWLAIPAIKIFGEDIGPRLPSVLAALASAALVWQMARRWISPEAGVLSALVLSGSLLMVAVGRMMLTDALLTASFTGCILLFWESLHGRPWLRLGAAACLGLAVLAKGPVSGIFFILIASLTYWRLPNLRPGFKGAWLPSIALGLLVIASWYLPCWLINGEVFVQKFLIEQNIGRFAGGDKAHGLPSPLLHPIYYPIVLAVGLLPWLPGAAKRGMFRPLSGEEEHRETRAFLWIWALTIIVFFSISGSKLPHYIVPAVPPLAMLAAERILAGRTDRLPQLILGGAAWSVFVLAAALFGFGYEYQRQKGPDLHGLIRQIRSENDPVVLFRFGRSQSDTDFSLQINETSRPSIFFYLRKPALKTSSLDEVLKEGPRRMILVAPAGRITDEDKEKAKDKGLLIPPVPLAKKGDYEAFLAIPTL